MQGVRPGERDVSTQAIRTRSLDTVSVTANGDLFNWKLAILDSPGPAPDTPPVIMLAAAGFGVRRRG